MTTQIMPQFKEEPGFNELRLGRKQITQEKVKWENIENKPTNLVTKNDMADVVGNFSEKIRTLEGEISQLKIENNNLKTKNTEIIQKNTQLENMLQSIETRIVALEQKP